jgi:Putative Flp pilus-assembly TadE/G-like
LRRNNEQGIVIILVAVVMLFVVGAMAALSIDVVTLYTARSEAQLAADGGALAGARVLANSGMTSASDATVGAYAVPSAIAVATQVAASNPVGGRNLVPGASPCISGQEICVNINQASTNFIANPQVTVQVQRSDLPTFFARIWGRTTITVKASATAEAYNPSYLEGTAAGPGLPVAPTCVKPWLLPNIDPSNPPGQIFDPASGAITAPGLLGWITPPGFGGIRLRAECTTNCGPPPTGPTVWRYYPGDPADFPAPSASSVACPGCAGFNNFQLSIAGCVQPPTRCNSVVHVDQFPDANRDAEAADAVDALAHTSSNQGDSVDTTTVPPPFQFVAGSDNPVVESGALGAGTDIIVSDSLVTVPVIDTTSAWPGSYPAVQIIGFVQLFLNPTGRKVPGSNHIHTQVVNLVGCGAGIGGVTGTPILGNGASPVAVRLISP